MKRLVPEVVQTSAMDCGVACLKALLEGHGIRADLGRLREACQVSVDGTSIDVLEDVARLLGLDAEQRVVPANHLFDPMAGCLPGMVVMRHPNGLTHFVVVWARYGSWLQVMDPGVGRRWVSVAEFQRDLYFHMHTVAADDWREWAGTDAPRNVLAGQLRALGAPDRLLEETLAEPGWRPLAALDAATRTVQGFLQTGALKAGSAAGALVEALALEARDADGPPSLPPSSWSARSADDGMVVLTGAVVLVIKGRLPAATGDLPPELAAALSAPPPRPARILWSLLLANEQSLGADHLENLPVDRSTILPLLSLFLLSIGTSLGVLLEALLLRGFLDLQQVLVLPHYRVGAVIAVAFFLTMTLLADGAGTAGAQWLGRRLETRLRMAFLARLPRLGDRYFHSRLMTDLAERSHGLYHLRQVPIWFRNSLLAACGLVTTTIGIISLDLWSFPILMVGLLLMLAPPLLFTPALSERDLRARAHIGALGRYYLDALLGAVPIRAHGAERNLQNGQEALLGEWGRAGHEQMRLVVATEAITGLLSLATILALVGGHLFWEGANGAALLLLWWSLRLPYYAGNLVLQLRLYPPIRNITLRLLEPLGTPVEPSATPDNTAPDERRVSIRMADLHAIAGGHPVLNGINLEIQAGEHVAVVGRSGAGKSTLLSLLLGWMEPSAGTLLVNDRPLKGGALSRLRQHTAWVDPEIRLWNRDLLANLQYGSEGADLAEVLDQAELQEVLERLPDGLSTPLGEGGSRLSGGQGQRVRLGRAMLRRPIDLVLLDEPFRGLDRPARQRLLAAARERWATQTLLCVTHDIGETLQFPRVLVIEAGVVVEDGDPQVLKNTDSRYATLLSTEERLRQTLWGPDRFKRLRLQNGTLVES